jgi:cytochrome c oxidase assembly protein subunit 15
MQVVSPKPINNPWLNRFAVLTAVVTFILVWMGGLVTSHGAGLAVPDWPNTYGYNMFFFPVSKWIGGIFYEHTHRLVASGVGLLTSILALWLFGYKSRPLLRWGGAIFLLIGVLLCKVFPTRISEDLFLSVIGLVAIGASFVWPKCEPSPKWLRTLGVIAFFAVVAQGVLGGLRVTQLKDELGIFHATLAQLFFLLVSALALFHSQFWRRLDLPTKSDRKGLRFFFATATALILCQLMLGATMRHQHAGLAIPDFPAAYGKVWPDTDAASIQKYNRNRMEVEDYQPITAFQIDLQMAHRILALAIFVAVATSAFRARKELGARHPLTRFAGAWFALIMAQVLLGAATIWTGKSADIATAHVACGALSLMTGGLVSILSFRMLAAPAMQTLATEKNGMTTFVPSSSITR